MVQPQVASTLTATSDTGPTAKSGMAPMPTSSIGACLGRVRAACGFCKKVDGEVRSPQAQRRNL